jgi:hypothetical protein
MSFYKWRLTTEAGLRVGLKVLIPTLANERERTTYTPTPDDGLLISMLICTYWCRYVDKHFGVDPCSLACPS